MSQTITMTQKELSRYETIKRLLKGELNGTEAAKQTGLSIRQVKRLKNKVKKYGIHGIIHGNRGKPSNRKLSDDKIKKVEKIIKSKYADFGPTFAKEKLEENHQIEIVKETLRLLMVKWGLWNVKSRKRNKEYRCWRQRKEQYGEMLQFDGSYEHWFEQRAPKCCLLAGIDDATGKIVKLKFVDSEGTIPVFSFWKEYVLKHGKPFNIYLDRLRTYKENLKSVADDPECRTQFQRAMDKQLGIKPIYAYSPQAKGRAERLFNTLQDRLIKELRLVGISTMKQANQFVEKTFIPQFNDKFSVVAQKKGDLHRSLNKMEKVNLDKIFSVQIERVVNMDFTVRHKKQWYQLSEQQPTLVLRKDRVLMEQKINGDMCISLRNKYLNFIQLPARPEKVKMRVTGLTRSKSTWKPPADHPWRKPFIINQKVVSNN